MGWLRILNSLRPRICGFRSASDGHIVLLFRAGRAAAIRLVFFEKQFQLADELWLLRKVVVTFGKVVMHVEEFAGLIMLREVIFRRRSRTRRLRQGAVSSCRVAMGT